jgi:hypothetical protein
MRRLGLLEMRLLGRVVNTPKPTVDRPFSYFNKLPITRRVPGIDHYRTIPLELSGNSEQSLAPMTPS